MTRSRGEVTREAVRSFLWWRENSQGTSEWNTINRGTAKGDEEEGHKSVGIYFYILCVLNLHGSSSVHEAISPLTTFSSHQQEEEEDE